MLRVLTIFLIGYFVGVNVPMDEGIAYIKYGINAVIETWQNAEPIKEDVSVRVQDSI